MTAAERAIAWRGAEIAAVCDRLEPWAHGVVAFASDIPGFWQYNQVRVEGAPELDADELAAVADELLAAFPHRFLEIEDQGYAERVRPRFEELGWLVQRQLVMRLAAEPQHPGPAVGVREGTEDEIRSMRREWHMGEEWSGGSERLVGEFMEAEDTLNARRRTRLLVARAGGEPAGYVRIRAERDAGEVLEAYLRPQHRGRGLGGALVASGARALQAAGADEVFIVADDEDRPKRLYARIGFEPARIAHELMRVPPA